MKPRFGLGVRAGIFGLVCATAAVACGGSDDTSFTEPGSGNGTAGSAGTAGTLNISDPNGEGGSDSTAGGAGSGAACPVTRLEGAPIEVNVLLVVDKSGSMAATPDGFESDKWTALYSALETAFQGTGSKIAFGLDLYPYSGTTGDELADACQMPAGDDVVVPVQAGAAAAPLILGALDDNPPSGGTPTAAALARALAYYTKGAGKGLSGEKYVLLATDGGPDCNAELTCAAATCTVNLDGVCPPKTNCCDAKLDPEGPSKCLDEDASVKAVADLAGAGIKTFVIGIPGAKAYASTLDLLAAESGVINPDAPPSYFEVSAKGGVAGLSQVFERITNGLITSCRLQLDAEPPTDRQLFVKIDGASIEEDGTDGWTLDDSASPPIVEFTGAICDMLESGGAQRIDITYDCRARVK